MMNCKCRSHGSGMVTKLLSLTALAAAGLMGGDRSAVVAAQASSGSSLTSNPEGCVTDYDAAAGVDYFPDKAVVEYATTFSVEYFPSYKVLNVTGFSTTTYVLYQCGTPQPVLEGTTVQQHIEVPVTNVSTGTPDHIPRIEVGFWIL